MRSCGSSAPARVAVAVSLLFWGISASPRIALAAQAQQPKLVQASPKADPEQDHLLLPAHDLEAVALPQELRVGDIVELRARGAAPDWIPKLPAGTETDGWALALTAPAGASASPGPSELTIRILVTRPGDLSIPSLVLADSTGKPVARTHPWALPAGTKIASAIQANDPKAQEPAPAVPPVHLRFPLWLAVLAGILALSLIGGVVYAAVRWSRRRKPVIAAPVKVEPPLPEDVAALKGFSDLESSGHLRRGEFKKYYFAISEILKTYIGARYRFDAPESTSREIIVTLEENKAAQDAQIDRLETLLQLLDRVKFTDHVPEQGEPERLLSDARAFVETTRRPKLTSTETGGLDAVR